MEEDGRNPVATLNIKNLPDALYRKLRARAKRKRRSISQEATRILERAVEEQEPLSLLELEGLGKTHWTGIEAAEHVDAERRSWD
jgi:plasmid stability protein